LHRALHTVARHYRFRDRDGLLGHGITATQCYAMSALDAAGDMTMRELSAAVGLDPSSMTRAVDGLVDRVLVRRVGDAEDRRRRRVRLTTSGRRLVRRIRAEGVRREAEVLRQVDPSSRADVVRATELVARGLEERASGRGDAR